MTVTEQLGLIPGRDPDELIAEARERYRPVASYCLFSGGHDSTVLAHRCRDAYGELMHIDTGTAVPGVREWVQSFADWLGKPVRVYEAGDAFRRLVLGDETWWAHYREAQLADPDLTLEQHNANVTALHGRGSGGELGAFPHGFPGPGQHGRAYTRLKERQIEALMRDAKLGADRMATVMLLSGKRRAESVRRGRTTLGIEKREGKSQIYVNPLIDWSTADMVRYRREVGMPESPVAALLHRSGECNCGAFAQAGEERAMMASLWPSWWRGMEALEREAEALGLRWCRWGGYDLQGNRAKGDAEPAGPLCSSCELRQLSLS